jgi:hypothetical protein
MDWKEIRMTDKFLSYGDFGAAGDGIADDFDAIIATHATANKAGLPVKADPHALYYIGGTDKTATVQTDTDWNTARFIIDDTHTVNRRAHVFHVTSKLPTVKLKEIQPFKKNQEWLDLQLEHDSLVVAVDETTKRFIREGPNQDSGTRQTDIFILRKDGRVDKDTAVLWDFDNVTSLTAHPMDPETLTLRGGHFITLTNQAVPEYRYFERNIGVSRSNVAIDGVTHTVRGQGERGGAPYHGLLHINECANITVQNCRLSAHKIYETMGSAGTMITMGTYDITCNRSVNLLFKDCQQINDMLYFPASTPTWARPTR